MAGFESVLKAMGINPEKLSEQFTERFGPQLKAMKDEYIKTRNAFWSRHDKHDIALARIIETTTQISLQITELHDLVLQSSGDTLIAGIGANERYALDAFANGTSIGVDYGNNGTSGSVDGTGGSNSASGNA